MLVVIDTNVLVSAFWSRDGVPAQIMALLLNQKIVPCYDERIMQEYEEVLLRPKFGFSAGEVRAVLDWVKYVGAVVIATPDNCEFVDETDRKFYENAKGSGAILITGNKKHFPKDSKIVSPREFLDLYFSL